MASFRPFRPIEDKIVIEKLAVITFNDEVNTRFIDTSNMFECKLNQPQRCSQEILDLANFYLLHHKNPYTIIQKQYSFKSSFSSGIIPLWIELENTDKFASVPQFIDSDDVLVLCKKDDPDIIKRCCHENNWSFHDDEDLRGIESTVIVLYVGNVCKTITQLDYR